MNLDARIKSISDIFTCINMEEAKQFIGQRGYFADCMVSFEDLSQRELYNLDRIDEDDVPFVSGNVHWRYFLPVDNLKPVKKKYRPYTIEEFLNEGFEILNEGFEIRFFADEQSGKYPYDTGGNVCYFGKYAVLNRQTADPAILKYLDSTDAVQIDVKQGYTKCSICVLDENSIITGDRITAEKAAEKGLDVLFSDPAFIKLEGFSHGFIGGRTFKITSDKLCFTGVLDAFPDDEMNKILDFCEKKGIEPVFLTDMPLFDIGGAIPVLER